MYKLTLCARRSIVNACFFDGTWNRFVNANSLKKVVEDCGAVSVLLL